MATGQYRGAAFCRFPIRSSGSASRKRTEFYGALQDSIKDKDARKVQRQAIAGMLWSKQVYYFDVPNLAEWRPSSTQTTRESGAGPQLSDWRHLNNADVISMPDTTGNIHGMLLGINAFHCVALALVDPSFAKTNSSCSHANGLLPSPTDSLPAYEWEFGDVNPPVACVGGAEESIQMDRELTGVADIDFLKRIFHKLMLNFTWWVNHKDGGGRSIFPGRLRRAGQHQPV